MVVPTHRVRVCELPLVPGRAAARLPRGADRGAGHRAVGSCDARLSANECQQARVFYNTTKNESKNHFREMPPMRHG